VPRKLPPYTELFRDRHGKLRVYFRRNKQRVPLPASIGSAEFEEAYSAAPGPTSTATRFASCNRRQARN